MIRISCHSAFEISVLEDVTMDHLLSFAFVIYTQFTLVNHICQIRIAILINRLQLTEKTAKVHIGWKGMGLEFLSKGMTLWT